ncbi:DDE_3 domain-containing protein [Trichonephila clavipes]|nr:DDE_3 domain-containing protein [Trichonephila clavipes]
MSKKRTIAEKATVELNQHLVYPVSIIIVRNNLYKQNIYGRASNPKPLVTNVNAEHCLQWCHTHKTWSIYKWKKVMWSDESSFTLFPTVGQVISWRTLAKAKDQNCLLPTFKHWGEV